MHEHLVELAAELERAEARVRRLAEGRSEEEWRTRPAEGSWSAAECIAHLNLTSEAYIPIIREALERARALDGGAPTRFRRDPIGWLLWKTTGQSAKMKMKTGAGFIPKAAAPKAETIPEFERLQREQIELVRQADGLPIQRVRIASPFDPRAKYSLFSALTILPGHQHRHLAQAERALGS